MVLEGPRKSISHSEDITMSKQIAEQESNAYLTVRRYEGVTLVRLACERQAT